MQAGRQYWVVINSMNARNEWFARRRGDPHTTVSAACSDESAPLLSALSCNAAVVVCEWRQSKHQSAKTKHRRAPTMRKIYQFTKSTQTSLADWLPTRFCPFIGVGGDSTPSCLPVELVLFLRWSTRSTPALTLVVPVSLPPPLAIRFYGKNTIPLLDRKDLCAKQRHIILQYE